MLTLVSLLKSWQMRKNDFHEPVMVREVLEGLGIGAPLNTQAYFIDATVGTGGHSEAILKRGGSILGIDVDKAMLQIAEGRLKEACPAPNKKFGCDFKLELGNFRKVDEIAQGYGYTAVDGILFDLGVSTLQLTSPSRGFSFSNPEAILDMRIDRTAQGLSAADLLNALREEQLKTLFSKTMFPGEAGKLARRVVEKRETGKFAKVGDFLEVCSILRGKKGLHPATQAFLALRMAVNSELENLDEVLPKAFALLKPGGRLLVITFHSGEEIVVVGFMRKMQKLGEAKLIGGPNVAQEEEIRTNPRARSAKLYILEKQ